MHPFIRVLAIGLGLVLIPAAQLSASVGSAQSALASISVDPSQSGPSIPANYMGFSHEWWDSPPLMGGGALLMGSPSTGTNPIYRQLIQNLLAYGAGPFDVRIGGNSTEFTTEPGGPDVVSPFAQLNADIGATFILSVNLGGDKPQLAADQASAYVQGMPEGSLDAIEIGNEPDFYSGNKLRASTYGFAEYLKDFATWRSAVLPQLPPNLKLAGPSWGSMSLTKQLPAFLDQEAPNLAIVTQHTYGGTACNTTNPPDYLLGASVSTTSAQGAASSVVQAHQRGLLYRMAEMNSISCAGEAGVSDVFASSLWATDILFELAKVGVDGVNFHTGNAGPYALFTFNVAQTDGGTTYSVQSIRPEYYGLVLFQQAAPAGAHLVALNLTTSANVKAWATQDGSGTVRVVVLNKDEKSSGPISVQLPGYGDATLTRLLAPGLSAQTGITLGGQTFDGSPDGTIQGEPASDTLAAADTYTFDMPAVSAALLVIPPAGS
jgi:hypothetical protein